MGENNQFRFFKIIPNGLVYAVAGWSVLGMIGENVLNHIDMSKLEKTAVEVRRDSSHVANLYGFSDNGNGSIDRIEIRGTIPGFRGGAIIAYHRTVTPSDSDFKLQYKRLKE